MKIQAIKCKKCGVTIFSRARHDFRWCNCPVPSENGIAIDGGFDYIRVIGNPDQIENLEIEVSQTKDELYNDWNSGHDKFGMIK